MIQVLYPHWGSGEDYKPGMQGPGAFGKVDLQGCQLAAERDSGSPKTDACSEGWDRKEQLPLSQECLISLSKRVFTLKIPLAPCMEPKKGNSVVDVRSGSTPLAFPPVLKCALSRLKSLSLIRSQVICLRTMGTIDLDFSKEFFSILLYFILERNLRTHDKNWQMVPVT